MRTDIRRQILLGDRLHILFGTIFGLFLAVLTGLWAVGLAGNPIKAVLVAVGGVLLIVGTLRPRVGLHALILCSTCLDFFKRFLISFGIGSMSDVAGVLAVAPMILAGTFLGTCVLLPIFTKKMLKKEERHLVYFALILFGIALAAGYSRTTSPTEILGAAVNEAAYALIIPIVFVLYRGKEIDELKKLLRFTAFAYMPVALYGVFQFWAGYSRFEVEYLQSGLTIIDVNLYDIHPRPFSTLNSPHSFSTLMWFMIVVSSYLAFHRASRFRCPRWLPLVFIGSLAFSLVRGAIVLAVANLAMGRWFKTRKGTVTFYMVAIGAMAALIAFSQPILDNLDNLQSFLPSDQDWQQQAFRLGTISDRLQGYQGVLLNPRMYTLFGHGVSIIELRLNYEDEGFSHDSLSQLLFRFGVVGVAFFVCVFGVVLWRIHSAVWRTKDPERKSFAAMLVSITVLILLSHVGGPSFHVFPINLFIWLFLGMAWTVCFGLSEADLTDSVRLMENPTPGQKRLVRGRLDGYASGGMNAATRPASPPRVVS